MNTKGILNSVRWFINLFFYSYLLFIPLFWFFMLGEYLASDSDKAMLTQIQHGKFIGAQVQPHEAIAAGKAFVLEETHAALWVKTESLAEFIFFSRIGYQEDFGVNFILPFFGLAITFLLKRIFDSLHKGDIFTAANAKRILQIGWVLIAKYSYMVSISFWLSNFLQKLNLPYEYASGRMPEGNDLHLGILILCIGLVYKEGVKLKREAELVI